MKNGVSCISDAYSNISGVVNVLSERELLHMNRRLATVHHMTWDRCAGDNGKKESISDTGQRYQKK